MLCWSAATAQITPQAPPARVTQATAADNERLKQIVQRDQALRTKSTDKSAITETDADQRTLVPAMIDDNKLHTALDFRNAALVFQHGSTPNDYLLAHTLAVIGASKGDRVALWLSAATLDRYLQSIKQPQVYGTQLTRNPTSAPWSLDPINEHLLPDSLREQTNVPPLDDERKTLQKMNADPTANVLLK